MTDKTTKLDLINSIKYHFLKKGYICQNINKMSKNELLEYIEKHKIECIKKNQLEEDIINIETYNKLRDIIYCNFMIYENISYDIISKIDETTTIEELQSIIDDNNLKCDNNSNHIKDLIFSIYKSYKNYCDISSTKNECTYITLPNLIKALKNIN
jgi:transcriptional/translational regulatory protein YebC/TACO1